MPIAYVPISLKTFDITELYASPIRATFFPFSLMAENEERTLIEPWPELDNEWDNHLREQFNRFLLTSFKRSDIKHYLRNPDLLYRGTTKKDKKANANFKNWAIKTFELQDNQIYLQAKVKKNGETRPAKYTAFNKRCNVYKLNALLKAKDAPIKLIIPTGLMDDFVIDLIDFRKEPNEGHKWIMQMKNPFTKFIELSPHKDKKVVTIGKEFDRHCDRMGNYNKVDNGTEFKGKKLGEFAPTQKSIEIANKVFKRRLRAIQVQLGTWKWVQFLLEIAFVFNTTPFKALPNNMTLYEAHYGRPPPNWDDYSK
ncbi:uncharacterized protein PAC_13452 [Phialocephala subalpina]|uniref:Integrase catalytic domain-containing protein n=1 Tax=Phialocephala subalpina TaxID=576137 RepID=A0A1L7XEU1_9HELO|nr:uncharacterized protein PAC_13452 [Phialocephala subalpina]